MLSRTLATSLFFAFLLPLATAETTTSLFDPTLTAEQLDPAAYAQWLDGSEQPLLKPDGTPAAPTETVVTKGFKKLSFQIFGKSKTPGPRHVRVGFTEPVSPGTILAVGDVSISVLKADAPYPGNPGEDSQWLPLERIAEGQLTPAPTKEYEGAFWIVPPGTTTRALRFTHDADMLDSDYAGILRGVQLFDQRLANLAPQAIASGGVSKRINKINNEDYDGWTAWENLDGKEGDRPQLISEDPEWLILTWPEPVTLRGTAFWWAGFGAGEVQTFVGSAETHPNDAPDKDWQTLETMAEIKNGYPVNLLALHWVDFGKNVTTRALRLRMTGVGNQPKDRDRNGKRVWLGEWFALSALGDQPATGALLASAKKSDDAETKGVIPIRFSLPEKGYVTLVIDDASGIRVRNLISETPFEAGEHTVWWDGSDDLGRDANAAKNGIYHIPFQPVAPGEYRVHGLWRKEIVPVYEFSAYSPGNPPWGNGSAGWLANHSPPQGAVFVPGGERSPTGEPVVYLGCFVTEGPDAVGWVDLDGKKLGGKKWIGGIWTGAPFMAYDAGPEADPAVTVYVGAGWKDDKVEDSSLLRLNALPKEGEAKPVKNFDLGKLPEGTKMTESLAGFSARNGVLVCSLGHLNQLLLVNAKEGGKELARINVESPRGSAFDAEGRLLVLSGTKLLRYAWPLSPDSKPEVLVAKGLEDPKGLAIGSDGNYFVSDWGASNQVKVFSPKGKLLRAIGDPGESVAGPYNPNHLNHPWGIAVDSKKQLWVTEHDELPRRVSVWSLDGKLLNALYGPGKYGGGGAVDPADKSRYYYAQEGSGTLEFHLDWEKGTSTVKSVIYRASDNDGLQLPKTLSAPETPLDFQGRRYFTNCYNSNPTNGSGAVLFLEKEGIARPVAAMGRATEWPSLVTEPFLSRYPEGVAVSPKTGKLPPDVAFLWTDANGDAQMQPDEVQMRKAELHGVTVMPDLSFVVAKLGGTFPNVPGKTLRFAPLEFGDSGIPRYDLAQEKVLAEETWHPASSGGSQALTDDSGWTALSLANGPFNPLSLTGSKDGKPAWSYPNLWPGLHAGHHAPRHSFPGEVIGTTRLLGGYFTVGDETFWAINSDQGGPYVFTKDGLFVSSLFQGVGVGKNWRMPAAERGLKLTGLTLGQENFWPTITATKTGEVILVDGARTAIVRLDGFDTVRRLDAGKVKVTEADLTRALALMQSREAERQQERGSGVLKVAMNGAVQADGNLADWANAEWVEIDVRGKSNVQGAVAIAGDQLLAAWKTGEKNLLTNTGENPIAPFKTGGALDLMIGTDPNAKPDRKEPVVGDVRLLITQTGSGKNAMTKALLYRAVVPGTKDADKVPFSSPWRTIHFDKVEDISDQVKLATDKEGGYEISVPLALLGLNPSTGAKWRGDIGILLGNGVETTARIYWSNKASGIVSDVPAEAQLTPALWGVWELGETP